MDQTGIIRDLLSWLESHLDKPLSIDNVAAKAGYSKWYLQRMFKEVTGQAIGAYIRGRRLSKSAVALRLTARPILDIALQYRFDSQQTYTRAFKRQFALTPAFYRRSAEWSAFGICPPLRLANFTLPQAKFITLPETHLTGTTRSYNCTLEEISDSRHEMRLQFWTKFLSLSPKIPNVLYGLNSAQPSTEKDDEQEIFYTTALMTESVINELPDAYPVTLEGGEYVQFEYQGPISGFQDFILMLYGTCMPMLTLTRRQGQDIERFFPEKDKGEQHPPTQIRCEYLIPIRR